MARYIVALVVSDENGPAVIVELDARKLLDATRVLKMSPIGAAREIGRALSAPLQQRTA